MKQKILIYVGMGWRSGGTRLNYQHAILFIPRLALLTLLCSLMVLMNDGKKRKT